MSGVAGSIPPPAPPKKSASCSKRASIPPSLPSVVLVQSAMLRPNARNMPAMTVALSSSGRLCSAGGATVRSFFLAAALRAAVAAAVLQVAGMVCAQVAIWMTRRTLDSEEIGLGVAGFGWRGASGQGGQVRQVETTKNSINYRCEEMMDIECRDHPHRVPSCISDVSMRAFCCLSKVHSLCTSYCFQINNSNMAVRIHPLIRNTVAASRGE